MAGSERTFSRQLFKDTGMSFGKWRRQLHLMVALTLLAAGKCVQQVTRDLGYEAERQLHQDVQAGARHHARKICLIA
ncbi:helix-turn-helix domain-containing protein [Pseudomonas monsensis]